MAAGIANIAARKGVKRGMRRVIPETYQPTARAPIAVSLDACSAETGGAACATAPGGAPMSGQQTVKVGELRVFPGLGAWFATQRRDETGIHYAAIRRAGHEAGARPGATGVARDGKGRPGRWPEGVRTVAASECTKIQHVPSAAEGAPVPGASCHPARQSACIARLGGAKINVFTKGYRTPKTDAGHRAPVPVAADV